MAKISRRRFLGESTATGVTMTTATAALHQLGGTAPAAEEKTSAPAAKDANGLRLCRYKKDCDPRAAFYLGDAVVDLLKAAEVLKVKLPTADSDDLLDFLPGGKSAAEAVQLYQRYRKLSAEDQAKLRSSIGSVQLVVPIPAPKKVILLAGNYNEHILEGGGQATEQKETYPYFFWKPPSTTLTNPGDPIRIPKISPDTIDWEIELGVIIGKACQNVTEKDALHYVAGYSVCNDVSDRKFRINPGRKQRPKDGFFDWLHGKWHDTFLPMGPCVRAADADTNPQTFPLKLSVNGQVMQNASTNQMIFPVAALVSILSSFVALEPGDVISTGTPAGTGAGHKPPIFLKKGDVVEAEIAGIGLLKNPVV